MKKSIALICIMLLIVTAIVPTMAAKDLNSQNNDEIINIPTDEIHITGEMMRNLMDHQVFL